MKSICPPRLIQHKVARYIFSVIDLASRAFLLLSFRTGVYFFHFPVKVPPVCLPLCHSRCSWQPRSCCNTCRWICVLHHALHPHIQLIPKRRMIVMCISKMHYSQCFQLFHLFIYISYQYMNVFKLFTPFQKFNHLFKSFIFTYIFLYIQYLYYPIWKCGRFIWFWNLKRKHLKLFPVKYLINPCWNSIKSFSTTWVVWFTSIRFCLKRFYANFACEAWNFKKFMNNWYDELIKIISHGTLIIRFYISLKYN